MYAGWGFRLQDWSHRVHTTILCNLPESACPALSYGSIFEENTCPFKIFSICMVVLNSRWVFMGASLEQSVFLIAQIHIICRQVSFFSYSCIRRKSCSCTRRRSSSCTRRRSRKRCSSCTGRRCSACTRRMLFLYKKKLFFLYKKKFLFLYKKTVFFRARGEPLKSFKALYLSFEVR